MHTLYRCGAAVFVAALVSACSSPTVHHVMDAVDPCQVNRSRCMYEGAYEPGERDYAELEARRLNHASIERLRRSGVR